MEIRSQGPLQKRVSRLCFGALTMGPLQCNLGEAEGASLLDYARGQGINVIDTADLYGNYPQIRLHLQKYPDTMVITKCHAFDRAGAQKSLEFALNALGRDYIDILLLHEQESELTLAGHGKALDWFCEQKRLGRIGSIGLSTHFIRAARAAAEHPQIDVIEAICNRNGLGIVDGTQQQMEICLQAAHDNGKFIVA